MIFYLSHKYKLKLIYILNAISLLFKKLFIWQYILINFLTIFYLEIHNCIIDNYENY